MHTDPIADFLTRIRNAQHAHRETVDSPSSTVKVKIAKILQSEGFIADVRERTEGVKKYVTLTLKYENHEPKIHSIKRVSKPGLRIYRQSNELPRVLSDLGIAIISTSAGIMTNKDARRRKLGGEVLCEIT
jgi:small subunit ribosomal protein S8